VKNWSLGAGHDNSFPLLELPLMLQIFELNMIKEVNPSTIGQLWQCEPRYKPCLWCAQCQFINKFGIEHCSRTNVQLFSYDMETCKSVPNYIIRFGVFVIGGCIIRNGDPLGVSVTCTHQRMPIIERCGSFNCVQNAIKNITKYS